MSVSKCQMIKLNPTKISNTKNTKHPPFPYSSLYTTPSSKRPLLPRPYRLPRVPQFPNHSPDGGRDCWWKAKAHQAKSTSETPRSLPSRLGNQVGSCECKIGEVSL